ncbi:MAG: hypothetical protein NTV29_00070, partial [Planctomycetota bacterium]|nr:hypothetical protein [Planctomycetota bacterium]
ALALWESKFNWVLLFQAKPNRLEFEKTLWDIHRMLNGELKLYREHVQANPADAIHREATAEFTGPERLQRLTRNLLRALKDEPILIVLDNFETNLKAADPATTLSACQDKAWDDCLALLANELVGSPSRILITCRRPLAALAEGAAHPVQLGPLPGGEAALYLREQPTLSRMVFGGDGADMELAIRLLSASRFHPLLMDRLAKLAAHAPPRTQLLAALETLEKTKDFAKLPALFAVEPGDAKELAYLDDALATSLDQLIRDSSTAPASRCPRPRTRCSSPVHSPAHSTSLGNATLPGKTGPRPCAAWMTPWRHSVRWDVRWRKLPGHASTAPLS